MPPSPSTKTLSGRLSMVPWAAATAGSARSATRAATMDLFHGIGDRSFRDRRTEVNRARPSGLAREVLVAARDEDGLVLAEVLHGDLPVHDPGQRALAVVL